MVVVLLIPPFEPQDCVVPELFSVVKIVGVRPEPALAVPVLPVVRTGAVLLLPEGKSQVAIDETTQPLPVPAPAAKTVRLAFAVRLVLFVPI